MKVLINLIEAAMDNEKTNQTEGPFTKERLIRIVARFAQAYNTEAFMQGTETLEEAIEQVKDLIEFDV